MVFAVAINYFMKLLLYDLKKFDNEPFLCIDISDPSLRKISYPPRNPWMTSMAFSTNNKWILIGTSGDAHYVYDSYEGVLLVKLEGFKGLEGGKTGDQYGVSPVKGISGEEVGWTSDSKFIIGGSYTGKICMWDCAEIPLADNANREEPKVLTPSVTLNGPLGSTRCVKMNPRHQMLATAGTELVRLQQLTFYTI